MISIKTNISAENVRLQGEHVLFVEGKYSESVDPEVLKELLDNRIRIETLGPSFSVKSVAEALQSHHPSYYFLIDRDHHDCQSVRDCWENFPNPDTHNLLVWRRREIENYFLEPDYLSESKYFTSDKEELKQKILKFSKDRLFLDAANHVVIATREELKKNWIEIFSKPSDFPSKEAALEKLKDAIKSKEHASNVSRKTSPDKLEERFNGCLELMTGGKDEISFGTGEWLNMIKGKKVLPQIINSEFFQVQNTDGKSLSGKEKLNAVIKDLLKKDESILPPDFKELKELIYKQLEIGAPRDRKNKD